MAKVREYTCDVCSAVKRKTIHWWTLRNTKVGHIELQPLSHGDLDVYMCGSACVGKMVEAKMGIAIEDFKYEELSK